MSFAKVYSAQTLLLKAHTISIEVDISKGLNSFTTVGLPDKAVEESRDRVSAAIKNTGFESPKQKNKKTVISLAPADIKKEGPLFDLPIALAYLLASGEVSFEAEGKLFVGELSLDGKVRPVHGILPLAKKGVQDGFREIYVPEENAKEAALIKDIRVYPVKTLRELLDHLETPSIEPLPATEVIYKKPEYMVDFEDIKGQDSAKRGLEIAAAGRHNVLMFGPPGAGKTMLAKAFTGILPALSFDEVLEVTSIHSVAGTLTSSLVTFPPLRSPHHTSSYVAMVGGGTFPKPGEVTLAHRGVLFAVVVTEKLEDTYRSSCHFIYCLIMEEKDFQKYIDNFRFQIVDENNTQRSSTWSIIHDEKSVYVFVRVHGGKMKLSFHPIGTGKDGNDTQYGLTRKHAQELEGEGYEVFNPLRWKRPNDKEKLNLGAKILFPTDFMTGEVFQFVRVKKPKISLPLAPKGNAVEVSVFFHYMEPEKVENILISKGFTPIFYMTLNSGEIATITARQTTFSRAILPKEGTYHGKRLNNEKIEDSKYLHGVLYNKPENYQPIQLVEVNGFQMNNQ